MSGKHLYLGHQRASQSERTLCFLGKGAPQHHPGPPHAHIWEADRGTTSGAQRPSLPPVPAEGEAGPRELGEQNGHPLTFRELLGQDQRGMQQSEEQPGPLPHEARHVYRSDMRLSVHKGEKGPLRVAPSVAPALQHRAVLAASRGEPAAVALNRKKFGFAHLPAPF